MLLGILSTALLGLASIAVVALAFLSFVAAILGAKPDEPLAVRVFATASRIGWVSIASIVVGLLITEGRWL
jgi:hypothetical protein